MGPLSGVKVVEFAAIGPAPFACMLLADLGADVTRVDRPAGARGLRTVDPDRDIVNRGKQAREIDLHSPGGVAEALDLVAVSDVLVEGLRPGVMERLGLGPDVCLERNPRLVYGRMTGWGQTGPRAATAGHDLNYLGLTGALHAIGQAGSPPPPPLNLVADYGGGGMLLAFGIVSALYERERSGQGQVVDAAMVDGVALLSAPVRSLLNAGIWSDEREANLLDGGAHFYRVYECADGRFVSVGALEPQFYAELLKRLELDPADWPQYQPDRWPELRERMADVWRRRPMAEWARLFEGSDACVAPLNLLSEAPLDPHLAARETFVECSGLHQPAPAPRFSRTPGEIRSR